MERLINFDRPRRLICEACQHDWFASAQWILDFHADASIGCPKCGSTWEDEHYPRIHHDPMDPALDDATARNVYWYHSSTHADWPRKEYDPFKEWSLEHQLSMRRDLPHIDWFQRQQELALHVGTYEAAIQNIFRRIADQGDRHKQFYLYRIRLKEKTVFRKEILREHNGIFGDVRFNDVCPPGIDIARYVNLYEDKGCISLALRRESIRSVQQIPIPLSTSVDWAFVRAGIEELKAASLLPHPKGESLELAGFEIKIPPTQTPTSQAKERIIEALCETVPPLIRESLQQAANAILATDNLEQEVKRAQMLTSLVQQPEPILYRLNAVNERPIL